MQIYYNQLDKQLSENLKPIYIIAGNEVYQEEACVEKIIRVAHTNDYTEHDVMYVEKTFDWSSFDSLNSNLSLFSEKKIIEIRFLTKTVGAPAEKKILECISNYDDQNILIFRLPELKAADFRKKYLGSKNEDVGLIRLYPITKKTMITELNSIVQKYKYKINSNCINFIADMYEGNMVSANQALIKIDLMIGKDEEVNLDFLKRVFSKDVDFEASNLVDYSIEGNLDKIKPLDELVRNSLAELKAEDANFFKEFVLWSLVEFDKLSKKRYTDGFTFNDKYNEYISGLN